MSGIMSRCNAKTTSKGRIMEQEEKKISRAKRKQLLKRLKEQIAPKKGTLYLAAFLSWVQFLMRVISFAIIAGTLASLYQGREVHFVQVAGSLVLLTGLGYIISIFAKNLQGVVSQYARNQLKSQFFKAFVAKNGDFGDGRTAADVLTVASQGIDSLDTYYSYYLSLDLRTKFNCLTVLLIVAVLFPWGSLIFLLSLPLIPISIVLMQKRSKRIMNRYWASYMDVGNLFLDDLKGLNTLYSYQADEKYETEFAEQAEDFRDATMELLSFQLQAVGYMDAVMYLGIGVAGFVAALMLGSGYLSLFTAIYFVLIATEFFTPIREAGYGMHLVMMNTKMADRIFSFLDSVPVEEMTLQQELPAFDQVTVDKISFAYDNAKVIFDQLSFTARKGEIFALAGESGRGKTTLAQLLLGKLQPSAGQIFYGDVASTDLSVAALHSQIMYVSADSYLLNSSILANLQLATDWSQEEIEDWLEEKGVLGFVHNLPDGLQTIVGENGNQLSPGQRQQVIAVRAILAKRSLYIFDEMTSSVDKDNEALMYELLELVARDAVVISITHKMSQVEKAQEVLFLGQLGAELASPAILYENNLEYAGLVNTQKKLEDLMNGN